MHGGPATPLLLLAATAAPASAFAADYLSAEQAERLIFPDADRFQTQDITLDAAQLRQLQDSGVRARSARWTLRTAWRQNERLGWVVVDDVRGKFELIGYAVGIAQDGSVRQVEVLSYRESHGGEVRLPAWRKQFVGKRAADAMELGQDIANISGATLSCRHLSEGVRRITRLVQWLRSEGPLREVATQPVNRP
jgi:hypothetical protein